MSRSVTKGSRHVSRLLRALVVMVGVATVIALTAGTSAAQPDRGGAIMRRAEGRPPGVNVMVRTSGTITSQGAVVLTGQLSCSNAGRVRIRMTLRERVGARRVVAHGTLSVRGECDGAWHPWVLAVTPRSGGFADGAAHWRARAVAYGKGHVHRGAAATVTLDQAHRAPVAAGGSPKAGSSPSLSFSTR